MFQSKKVQEVVELKPIIKNADYARESEKLTRLRREAADRESRLRATETEIHRILTSTEGDDEAAVALLRDGNVPEIVGVETLTARAADLRRELVAYRKAMTIQKGVMAQLRAELSVTAAEVVAPAHRAAGMKALAAMAALREALAEEKGIRADMVSSGFDDRLPSLHPPVSVKVDQSNWDLAQWERRVRSYVE